MLKESLGRLTINGCSRMREESAHECFKGDERKGYRDFVPGRLVVLLDFGDKADRGDMDIGAMKWGQNNKDRVK